MVSGFMAWTITINTLMINADFNTPKAEPNTLFTIPMATASVKLSSALAIK